MKLTFRPIDQWPGEFTANRLATPFSANWTSTKDTLGREIAALQRRTTANDVIVQLAVPEGAIRQDGQMIKGRKPPEHPGCIISFDTPNGPLRFSCDKFGPSYYRPTLDGWQSNARAIALGLEALRKVERYGLGTGTEQYAGFQALPPGTARWVPAGSMTRVQAAEILAEYSEPKYSELVADRVAHGGRDVVVDTYRRAAKRHHPDKGGDPDVMPLLVEARDVLLAGR